MTAYIVEEKYDWSIRWERYSGEFMTLDRETFNQEAALAIVRVAVGWNSEILVINFETDGS